MNFKYCGFTAVHTPKTFNHLFCDYKTYKLNIFVKLTLTSFLPGNPCFSKCKRRVSHFLYTDQVQVCSATNLTAIFSQEEEEDCGRTKDALLEEIGIAQVFL